MDPSLSQPQRATLMLRWLANLTLLLALAGCQTSRELPSPSEVLAVQETMLLPRDRSKQAQQAITPNQALDELKQGNARFVMGRPRAENRMAEVRATAAGQYPFAAVLSCLDSRQPIEMIFDQGIGDVFNARVAGNILNEDILGSLEFACAIAGAKLIAVIGHTSCGAVKGACDEVEFGHLTGLLNRIQPAVEQVPLDVQPRNAKNDAFVEKVAAANVQVVLQQIREQSPILRELIEQGQIGLVGGMYDLQTGQVEFYAP